MNNLSFFGIDVEHSTRNGGLHRHVSTRVQQQRRRSGRGRTATRDEAGLRADIEEDGQKVHGINAKRRNRVSMLYHRSNCERQPVPRSDAGTLLQNHEQSKMADKSLIKSTGRASLFLKTLSNRHRLLILCYLADAERSVSELAEILGLSQPALSQQLARLRADRLVTTRRDGKSIHYSLSSREVRALIGVLHQLFCAPQPKATPRKQRPTASVRRP